MKASSILERRLKSRAKGSNKLLEGTSGLHDNVKIIKKLGVRMSKFCHVEILLQMYVVPLNATRSVVGLRCVFTTSGAPNLAYSLAYTKWHKFVRAPHFVLQIQSVSQPASML